MSLITDLSCFEDLDLEVERDRERLCFFFLLLTGDLLRDLLDLPLKI